MHWLGIRLVRRREDFVDAHGNVRVIGDGDDEALPTHRATPAPPPEDPDDDVPF
jgi:hypothetical protein